MSAVMKWFQGLALASLASLAAPAVAQTTVRYVHTDALGSVVAMTDQNRAVVERREYEPYGQQLTMLEDGPGYTGHVQDAATGLTYMQQRYYDPALGLFLSVDAVTPDGATGAYFHRYRYANDSPYFFTDPDGRMARFDDWLARLAAIRGDAPPLQREANDTFIEAGAEEVEPVTDAVVAAHAQLSEGVDQTIETVAPDYVQAGFGVFGSGEVAYTRDGSFFAGGSFSLNPFADGKKGGAFVYGFMLRDTEVGDVNKFVQGGTATYGGCFYVCAGFSFNAAGSAVLLGGGSPQLWLPAVSGMEEVASGLPSY